jgi:hypothetical protein
LYDQIVVPPSATWAATQYRRSTNNFAYTIGEPVALSPASPTV